MKKSILVIFLTLLSVNSFGSDLSCRSWGFGIPKDGHDQNFRIEELQDKLIVFAEGRGFQAELGFYDPNTLVVGGSNRRLHLYINKKSAYVGYDSLTHVSFDLSGFIYTDNQNGFSIDCSK